MANESNIVLPYQTGWVKDFWFTPEVVEQEAENATGLVSAEPWGCFRDASEGWECQLPIENDTSGTWFICGRGMLNLLPNGTWHSLYYYQPGLILLACPEENEPEISAYDEASAENLDIVEYDPVNGQRFFAFTPTGEALPEEMPLDLSEVWQSLLADRKKYPKPESEQAALAQEVLLACQRWPEGNWQRRWISRNHQRVLDVNAFCETIHVWTVLDSDLTRDMFLTIFDLQREDGSIPAIGSPHTTLEGGHCRPILLQSIRFFLEDHPDPAFEEQVLPSLEKYLHFTLSYYDPRQEGTPIWRQESEALVPDLWADDMVAVELMVWLIGELRAFNAIKQQEPDQEQKEYLRILNHKLNSAFWNDERSLAQSRFTDGTAVKRAHAGYFIASVSPYIKKESIKECLASLNQHPGIWTENGLRTWEYWDGDEVTPSFRGKDQLLFFMQAERNGLKTTALEVLQNYTNGPEFLCNEPANAACLILALRAKQIAEERKVKDYPALVKGLERHRYKVLFSVLAVLFSGVLLGLYLQASRKVMPYEDSEALAGYGEYLVGAGRYDEAISWYDSVIPNTHKGPLRDEMNILRGNALFKTGRFLEAKEAYNSVYEKNDEYVKVDPKITWNLAQAHLKLEEYDQAESLLNDVLDRFGKAFPRLANQAEIALKIVRERKEGL